MPGNREKEAVCKGIRDLFDGDDGSLPEIELSFGESDAVSKAYETLRSCASGLAGETAGYWSIPDSKDVAFSIEDNPAPLVTAKLAQPFHVVLEGVRSLSGENVPDLGVFVFPDRIAIDYRMGPEWAISAVVGLFEILDALLGLSDSPTMTHRNNIRDPDGSRFRNAWTRYRKVEN